MQGQMSLDERQGIYATVLEIRPRQSVECGTWFGGGSTLAIARALAVLDSETDGSGGKGPRGWVLDTYDIEADRVTQAQREMRQQCFRASSYVRFHCGDFIQAMHALAALPDAGAAVRPVDLALIDGPEDAQYTRDCIDAVIAVMDLVDGRKGTFIFHDWNREKCRLVREWVASCPSARVVQEWTANTGMARVEVVQ